MLKGQQLQKSLLKNVVDCLIPFATFLVKRAAFAKKSVVKCGRLVDPLSQLGSAGWLVGCAPLPDGKLLPLGNNAQERFRRQNRGCC